MQWARDTFVAPGRAAPFITAARVMQAREVLLGDGAARLPSRADRDEFAQPCLGRRRHLLIIGRHVALKRRTARRAKQ
eukprot:3300293-Pleurochrysis_carterae.AAC.1